MATVKAAPARRTRREPAYFYRSATATIDGDVRFGEGCVVLPHARVVVPPGYRLDIGPFTLIADGADVSITAAPSKGAAPPTLLRIGSHNHIHSYARLHFEVKQNPHAGPQRWELLGAGNVFQAFATLRVSVPAAGADDAQVPCQLGNFNVCTVHAHVRLSPRPAVTAPPVQPPRGAGGQEGAVTSPAPTMPPLESSEAHRTDATATALSVDPAMPGRVSVEERLFQQNSSDDDDAGGDAVGGATNAVAAAATVRGATHNDPAALLPPAEAAALSTRINSRVFLSGPDPVAPGAAASAAAVGVPRYGTRSVSELPTIIKHILDDEKQRRAAEDGGHAGRKSATATTATTTDAAAAPSEPASPIAAAAAALTNLSGYVESVHPNLRTHTEQRVLAEAEGVCRLYIRQYIDDADLHPVDGQHDADGAL